MQGLYEIFIMTAISADFMINFFFYFYFIMSSNLSKASMIRHIRAMNKSIKDQYVLKNLPKLSREQLEKAFNKRFQEATSSMGQKFYKPKGIYAETSKVLSDGEYQKLSPHKTPIKKKAETKKEEPAEPKKATPLKLKDDEYYLRIKDKQNKTSIIKVGKKLKEATKKFIDRREDRKNKNYNQMTLFKGDKPTKALEFSA